MANQNITFTIPIREIQLDSTFIPVKNVYRGIFGNHLFALKVLKEECKVNYEKEYKVDYWSGLDSRFIVRLHFHGTTTVGRLQEEVMLISEFCNGGKLSDLIRNRFPHGLDRKYYGLLLQCIHGGLSYLASRFSGLLNRNIMPTEIYLHQYPDGREIFKLNGFHNICERPVAGVWEPANYEAGDFKCILYSHPRVLQNIEEPKYTEKTNSDKTYLDVYSSGMVLYEAATGQPSIQPYLPIPEPSPEEVRKIYLYAYKIKRTGILSMIQRESDGPWEQSDTFPEFTNILREIPELKNPLQSLIAESLAANRDEIMEFQDFLDECESILGNYYFE